VPADPEAVVVLARRVEPADLDVDRMAERGRGDRAATAHQAPEALVVGDLPLHRQVERGMPPRPSGASGSGASRVQSTTPSGRGSPEATPSVNG
jgi:hypothetical protein